MDWHSRFTQQAGWTADLRRFIFQRVAFKAGQSLLEVGCGTGAVLEAIEGELPTPLVTSGVDIDREFLGEAKRNAPGARLVQGDAHALPYREAGFDLVVCHFLLLWVHDPAHVLREMARVARPGGWIAAIAEPDYGGRVDYPEELIDLGRMQEESLRRQGAEPRLGRRLRALFGGLGLKSVTSGVLGAQWQAGPSEIEMAGEWAVIEEDLRGLLAGAKLEAFRKANQAAWKAGARTLFVPTFYAIGMKE